jgi:hypothetical protein
MATHKFVPLEISETDDFADLTGISVDLLGAKEWALMLKKIRLSEHPNWDIVEPLSTAILVRYSRSFVSGVRKSLNEEALLSALSEEQRQKHAYLRAYRDKHIAHSVNSFEENTPVGWYCVERVAQEGITAVECNHHRVISMSLDDVENVIELTSALLQYIDHLIADEKIRVLKLVREKSLDEILSKQSRASVVDMKRVAKSRSQL